MPWEAGHAGDVDAEGLKAGAVPHLEQHRDLVLLCGRYLFYERTAESKRGPAEEEAQRQQEERNLRR